MQRTRRAWLPALLIVLAAVVSAQVIITSTIVGTVTDPQGAVIVGANVTLENVDTGIE